MKLVGPFGPRQKALGVDEMEIVGGVRLQALCPGLVKTEFHEQMGVDPASFPAGSVMSPEDVVQASLASLALGEVVCVPSLSDPALLARVDESQRQVFSQARSNRLADRYQS